MENLEKAIQKGSHGEFEETIQGGNPEEAVAPAPLQAEIIKNAEAILVEQYFEKQLEIMELRKLQEVAVNDAIQPENKGKVAVFTAVGRKFFSLIEEANGEKIAIEDLLREKGLDPRDYILQ